ADCDAVSDAVRRVDELPEDAVLRSCGLRRARELRGYVVVARILGDDLHFAPVHARLACAIARTWGTRFAGPEQPDTRRCGAARAHARSWTLSMAVVGTIWLRLFHPYYGALRYSMGHLGVSSGLTFGESELALWQTR